MPSMIGGIMPEVEIRIETKCFQLGNKFVEVEGLWEKPLYAV
jgi:hypothetical protein